METTAGVIPAGADGHDRLLPAVRRLSSAWRSGATPDEVLIALARELREVAGLGEIRIHTLGEASLHASRVVLDGPDRGLEPLGTQPADTVAAVFGDGRARTKGPAAFLPLFADSTVLHVLEAHSTDGRAIEPVAIELALTLVTPASAALAVLDAQAIARVDPLTGLLNRPALVGRLEAEMAQARRSGSPLCLLFADLDDFKAVNEELGHLHGDEVLRSVADALGAQTRPYDHLARYGGDEFVIVLPLLDESGARMVAERIRQAVLDLTGVALSLGLARWRDDEPVASFLDRADEALRRAKARGKDQTSGETGRMRRFRRSPETTDGGSIRALLDSGEGIRACFQPIIDLGSDTVVAYEALSRGPAGTAFERPDRMLEAARAQDQLVELDTALRLVALNAAADAGLRAPCTLFVNCEPETASRLGRLEQLWTRNDAPFESIVEITERLIAERPAELLAAVTELRAAGWGIALDDVGADERALALIPFLRPDVIKLDLRLVQQSPSGQAARVFSAVNAYAEESGAIVLAEGIETEQHLALALALGATLGQGYLFGRPGALPERIPPSRIRLPNLPAPADSRDGSPFEIVRAARKPRHAPHGLLDSIGDQLADQAASMGPSTAVLARLDPCDRFGRRRLERLSALRDHVGFVAAVGPGLAAESMPGVRTGSLRAGGDERPEWALVVCGSHTSVALVAREAVASAAGSVADQERQYEFVLTHDRALVTAAARALMANVAPSAVDPVL